MKFKKIQFKNNSLFGFGIFVAYSHISQTDDNITIRMTTDAIFKNIIVYNTAYNLNDKYWEERLLFCHLHKTDEFARKIITRMIGA